MQFDQLEAIEHSIKNSKELIEFANAIRRLRNNADFKKVILDGYFRDEAVRLVHLKGSPDMDNQTSQESIDKQINAISQVSAYLNTALYVGDLALKSLAEDEAMLEELVNEGNE